ncbi:MAG TPA: FixH family protein [Nitriliruptorales bacterium]|nr:FixH family protein [Nitriliruptorales bacterium]
MTRWWRVLGVLAVASIAFGGGLLLFSDGDGEPPPSTGFFTPGPAGSASLDTAALATQAAELGCAARTVRDDAYRVTVDSDPQPPRAEGTTFRLRVTRDGQPVEGARVCFLADMTEMSHRGVNEEAVEVGPGVYQVETSFVMRGGWSGRVKVIEQGQPAVAVGFGIDVQ